MAWQLRGVTANGTCSSQSGGNPPTTSPMSNSGTNTASFQTQLNPMNPQTASASIKGTLAVIYDWDDPNNPPPSGAWHLGVSTGGSWTIQNGEWFATFPYAPGVCSGITARGFHSPAETHSYANTSDPTWSMTATPVNGVLTFSLAVDHEANSTGAVNCWANLTHTFNLSGFTPHQ